MVSSHTRLPHLSREVAHSSRPVAPLVTRQVATERLMATMERLAPLPSVVMEVIKVAEDPDATVAALEQGISQDPVLTARVFKLANSSFYARGMKIATIYDAVNRLGFTTIKHLTLAAGASTVLTRSLVHYPYTPWGLWQHSLSLALVARTLARHLSLPADLREELFLAGLMHDIGKLVLDPLLGETGSGVGRLTTARESELLGLDHTEVGARLATTWHLPASTVAVIAQHHTVSTAMEYAQHSAVIHLADVLLNHAKVGLDSHTEVEQAFDPTALSLLGLDAQSVGTLEEVVAAELPTVLGMCEELVRC